MAHKLTKFLALLLAASMLAAACGGSGSDGGDEGATETTEGESSTPSTVVAEEEAAEGSDGPTAGGTLVYGIEADSANPWAPYRVSCAISCLQILSAISDPLFLPVTSGGVEGNLVESFEANEDYTVHTWTIREGITFHDGTPLDAEAVAFNINTCRFSSLTGSAFLNVADVQADGQVLTITTASPHVPLETGFAGSTCSYMFSPTWLASLADVPFRTEGAAFFSEEIAATPADGDPAAPVGLGAFVFESYTPGNGNSLVATKNPDYWRGPNGVTGEELPYLDSVEFVVAVDIASRSTALRGGEFDIIHTSNADEIVSLEEDDEIDVIATSEFGDTSYALLNVGAGENPTLAFVRGVDSVPMDPEGTNAANPLIHLSCRKALAEAIDQDTLAQDRWGGIAEPANGPFPPGSIGYLEDTGYPTYDPEAAVADFETCKADAGTDTIQVVFNTTNDPFNVETNQTVAAMWADVFGDEIEVSISPIEQGQYIGLALSGAFEAQAWRNLAGIDPDQQYIWWHSATASPIGELALNFGRFQDPVIDENLAIQRASSDPDARREAAEAINRSFAENVWNLWYVWSVWGIASGPEVHGMTVNSTPEGSEARGVIAGRHSLISMWCDGGVCDA